MSKVQVELFQTQRLKEKELNAQEKYKAQQRAMKEQAETRVIRDTFDIELKGRSAILANIVLPFVETAGKRVEFLYSLTCDANVYPAHHLTKTSAQNKTVICIENTSSAPVTLQIAYRAELV